MRLKAPSENPPDFMRAKRADVDSPDLDEVVCPWPKKEIMAEVEAAEVEHNTV